MDLADEKQAIPLAPEEEQPAPAAEAPPIAAPAGGSSRIYRLLAISAIVLFFNYALPSTARLVESTFFAPKAVAESKCVMYGPASEGLEGLCTYWVNRNMHTLPNGGNADVEGYAKKCFEMEGYEARFEKIVGDGLPVFRCVKRSECACGAQD